MSDAAAALASPASVAAPARTGWEILLWPPLVVAAALLIVPQAFFMAMSFHENLGMGIFSETFSVDNYLNVFTDSFYLRAMWLTLYLSVAAAVINLVVAFPLAYLLARLESRIASWLVVLLLVSSFISVVIKTFGLSLMLGQDGIVNHALVWSGVIASPLRMLNNEIGVLIGLIQFTLPLLVMLQVSVIQTIPKSVEDAAEIHGANFARVLWRLILPIARPGLIAGGFIAFNMNMGAFTSAVLLGGGRVLTFPVLIQRKIILDVDYPTGAAMATILLVFVIALNLVSSVVLNRRTRLLQQAG